MKTRTKRILSVAAIFFFVLGGLGGWWVRYVFKYIHWHCILQTSSSFKVYSSEHQGHFPYSTNGFSDALMIMVNSELLGISPLKSIPFVCGPDDDGHVFAAALTNHSIVPEDLCSRVYIQGLSELNDENICILFDRNSCKGGDHGRSPWAPHLREACLLGGAINYIHDEDWPEFSRKQVDLLVAAGFSKTNALHFYPAAQ